MESHKRQTVYFVQTEQFKGPLELLLELVEKRKLFINDISLAQVADDYVSRVRQMGELSLPQSTQFLQIAATLLLIKSRSLLPQLQLTDEEEADIDTLKRRLKMYHLFKQVAAGLHKRPQLHKPRKRQRLPRRFAPPATLSSAALHAAMRQLLAGIPVFPARPEVHVEATISLGEMITELAQRIARRGSAHFSSVARRGNKKELIVSFLALLELMRKQQLRAVQKAQFADIYIEQASTSVPEY